MVQRSDSVVLHELPDGTYALADTDRGVMLVVNDVGAAIWTLLGEEPSLDDVVAAVVETLGAPEDRARADLDAFLASLRAHGLVT